MNTTTDLCTFEGVVTSAPEAYNILGHLAAAHFSMDCPLQVDGAPYRGTLPLLVTCQGSLAEEAASPLGLQLGDRVKVTGELLATGEVSQVIAAELGFADDAEPVNLFDE